ncbi:conserved exported hypothetical protein [Candidatus Sulfotelmatomonas gaucii]|uniref:Soil-associated protein, TIGR03435 family n=1 Tax=Candidatus Sulfuritelmatomonas gaucii TaxID=2043161 RepID=A0A2N9LQC8_9BACT|nr:conserved exported hypothetical protein [Candidatus Sulfotelmatomonas gaucii]
MLRIARTIAAGSFMVISGAFGPAQAAASTTVAPTAFEVATVKSSDPTSIVAIRYSPGGRFITSNTSLRLLITWAYDITAERLVATPGWLDSARFDVTGKSPIEHPTHDQLHLMVQTLLADRFNLRVHREQRQLSLYRLEMDDGGPRVHVLDPETVVSQDPFNMMVLGRLSGTHVTAAMLAKVLSNQLGRYVEDKTGFNSVFDFTLVWRPEGASPEDMPADDDRPSIFTAIREQLGFRLVPVKGPVEVISIDHVERYPTAN